MFTTRYKDALPGTYSRVFPTPLRDPYWIGFNASLAEQLSLPLQPNDDLLKVMSGQALIQGHDPIAQKYAGHQFGVWNPDLGDGRGLLLGEWRTPDAQIWEMHLKGAGKTPYSRFGDGRAVLRSSIREFLGSEALHALGIASTRALALIGSSEAVYREQVEPGAALLRMTPSHLRFGHFEWFAHSGQHDQLRALVDFAIAQHFPSIIGENDEILLFFDQIMATTAKMVAGWQAYGFVHGVMNTDNMSLLGETFDYGPFGFLDRTDLKAVFNHTDAGGRYAFDQQPSVALWNLQQLAVALSPLTSVKALAEPLQNFQNHYSVYYTELMTRRLGGHPEQPLPIALIEEWLAMLAAEQKDFHTEFRWLSQRPLADWSALVDRFIDRQRCSHWLQQIQPLLVADDAQRMQQMQSVNPATVARTEHLQTVIDRAHAGSFAEFDSLLAALQSPFTERDEWWQWHQPPAHPEQPVTLSCSS